MEITHNSKKVLSSTYLFTSVGLFVASIAAAVASSLYLVSGLVSVLVTFVLALVCLFAALAKAESIAGFYLSIAFYALMGALMSPVVAMVDTNVLLQAALGTIIIFGLLSAYVISTKKDFSAMGGFLFVALIGLIIASVINIFLSSPLLDTVLAYATLLIFSGYVLYDTSQIIRGEETNYIRASLNMFLNVVNIFQALISLSDD